MIVLEAAPDSPVQRLDPRVRVVVTVAFTVAVVLAVRVEVLLAASAAAVALAAVARVRPRRLLRSLRELNLLMAMLALLLPLSMGGEVLLRLGPLTWGQTGLERAGLIALRANAAMIALVALIGTMEAAHLGFALEKLGVPAKLTGVLLFLVRYVEVVHREYHRLRDAMKLRGFRPGPNRHTLRTFGYLLGVLLVRSLDRSERIVEAMKCRGFRGRLYVLAPFAIRATDVAFLLTAVAAAAAIGVWGWA